MCVQSSSVLRVLQFTPFNVVCYVLHRSVSQVIHGQQLSSLRQSLQSSQWQSERLRRHLAWTPIEVRSSNPFTHQACDFPVGFNTNSRHCTPQVLALVDSPT